MNTELWQLDSVSLAGVERPRLQEVSLLIPAGFTAVIGYSGAGKTSLLNLLVGFERPDAGTVTDNLPKEGNRLPLFWVPPDDGLWPHLSVIDHLLTVQPIEDDDSARELLDQFDLLNQADAFPNRLSAGERSRLAVARALCSGAAVLVMDEPLVHVDPARVGGYWKVLRQHCDANETSLVFATHAPETVLAEAQHAICLTEGSVLYSGGVDELYSRPATAELAECLGAANWLPADEARHWLNVENSAHPCYRPERIAVREQEQGPFVVQSSRFAGSVAEVELLDENTQRRRYFYHRPSGNGFRRGTRVIVETCLILLLCFCTWGCGGDETAPVLEVKNIRHRSMPADGPRIPGPRGLTVGPNDELYVLDNAGRVLVYDADGKPLREWKMPDYDVGKPEGICIFKDGRIAVADTHYHRVVFFAADGKVLGMQGSLGKEPGQFIYPVAIIQDDSENFYVCEYGDNDRVQKFAADGTFLLEFGSFGVEPGQFQRPSGIVWHAGQVYVVDAFNSRIQVFSDDGKFVKILGDIKQTGGLNYPYDIVKSKSGDLFVVEYRGGCVSRFDIEGKLLGRFGSTGRGKGQFATPWGLAIDSRNRLFVADTGNRRIVELEL